MIKVKQMEICCQSLNTPASLSQFVDPDSPDSCPNSARASLISEHAFWLIPSQAAPAVATMIAKKSPMKSKTILIIMTTSQNNMRPVFDMCAPIARKMSAITTKRDQRCGPKII